MVFSELLKKIINKENLSNKEARFAFNLIMSGKCTDIQISAFLALLSAKGESTDEVLKAVKVLRNKSIKIKPIKNLLDTCGTGGDGKDTLNISTATAILTASCGVKVAKHGNRSVSSKCGSSDVLSSLGVNINAKKSKVEKSLKNIGLCFLMAPLYHSAMKNVANVRQNLKIKTIFNILGPLINPANADRQLIGVYSRKWLMPMAKCLQNLSIKKAWLVHGLDGLDEITTTCKTIVLEVKQKKIRKFEIDPLKLGFKKSSLMKLKGKDKNYNAKAIIKLFSGKSMNSPFYDIVILNTAAALVVSEKEKNLRKAIITARETLDKGLALKKLNELVRASQ